MRQIALTADQALLIDERMRTGAYGSEQEVIDDALARLVEDDLENEVGIESVRAAIQRGTEELRAGQSVEVTDEEAFVRDVVNGAKERGKRARGQREPNAPS